MHFIVHVLSFAPITRSKLEQIMAPFDEDRVFKDVNEDTEEWLPVPRPQFTWDYYTIHDEIQWKKPADCFALIAPDGYCIARKWWDGRVRVDREKEFERYCQDNEDKWAGKAYMVEVDCHV